MGTRVYRYRALDPQGKASHGTIEAPTEEQAMTLLARQDLVVQEIREVDRETPPRPAPKARIPEGGVSAEELASFAYELSALLSSGVQLAQALELQVKDRTRGRMDPVVLDLLRQVRAGTPFSQALESHPGVFPPIFPALVRSGEGTGNVDKALAQLSDFFEKIDQVKNRILSAMSYPVVVSGMALVIITALFIFMVPRFNQIYEQIGVPVPTITRLVLDLGQYADEAVLTLVLAAALATPVLRRVLSTPAGRLAADRLKLRLPVVGEVFRQVALANF
ncbi:MAG TPA: type II secretion system F family protein, partial [Candidatus Nitrosotenuis sp.]|nr:type II secretion system F family protein [Candidatus Nitrosotenuis sp.]